MFVFIVLFSSARRMFFLVSLSADVCRPVFNFAIYSPELNDEIAQKVLLSALLGVQFQSLACGFVALGLHIS
jgi:hypothetical protein